MEQPLSHAEQRVLIAQDVIERIQGDLFIARTGLFFEGAMKSRLFSQKDTTTSAQTVLRDAIAEGESCQVCAKGALLVSHILRFNEFSCKRTLYACEATDVLVGDLPYFSRKMLDEIEVLFEGRTYVWTESLNSDQVEELIEFYQDHLQALSETDRVVKIMSRLIKSGGERIVLDLTLKSF